MGKLGPMSEYVKRAAEAAYVTDKDTPENCKEISPSEEIARLTARLADQRKGEEAKRSLKLMANLLYNHDYKKYNNESNQEFVGRILRELLGHPKVAKTHEQ